MAYALIAWDKAEASSGDVKAIEAELAAKGSVRLFSGLHLYPEDGPRWTEVMDYAFGLAKAHAGLEVVVIMPSPSDRVGGWIARKPDKAQDGLMRKIMNESGDIWPKLFKPPAVATSDDWDESVDWQREE